MCALGDVYRSAVPSALLLESETVITQKAETVVDDSDLSDDEFLVYQAIQQSSSLKVSDIVSILNKKHVFPVIQKMMAKGLLLVNEEVSEIYKPKLVRYVRLHTEFQNPENLSGLLDILKNAAKQKDLVLAYFQLFATEKKPITVSQLVETSGSSQAIVKALVEKEIFEEYYLQHDRVNFEDSLDIGTLQLSDAQQAGLNAISASFETKEVTLLHGVTSSGKQKSISNSLSS